MIFWFPRKIQVLSTYQVFTQVYDSRPHGFALEGCGDFAYNFDLKHAYLAYGFRFVLSSILHWFQIHEVHKLPKVETWISFWFTSITIDYPRSDEKAFALAKDFLGFTDTNFHQLKLVSELCYHLDTAMLNLSQGHALVFKPAFDKESFDLIK